MKSLLTLLFAVGLTVQAEAKIVTRPIEYKQAGTTLEGYLAYDDSIAGRRPGVVIVHEWWGVNDFVKHKAEELAELGYVALAIDMYGKGVLAKTREEAAAMAGKFRGQPIMRERARAGLDQLAANELVDPKRIAAIGFCFGGTCCLELAYSGADLAAVVTFHGGLTAPKPEDQKRIHAKILALHGADDPFVNAEAVVAFEKGMREAGVDWQLVKYGGAVHTFTNPEAGTDNSRGAAYNEPAARRSWQAMQDFFNEVLRSQAARPAAG